MAKDNEHRPRILRTYATWLIGAGNNEEALPYLDKLLEKSDQIAEVHYFKAVVFANLRRYRDAKESLVKTKTLNSNYPGIDYQLEKLKNY